MNAIHADAGDLAPADRQLVVVGDLVGADLAVAVAVPRRDPRDRASDLADAEMAVAIQIHDGEDRPALVGDRQDHLAPRGLRLLIDERVDLLHVELAVAVRVHRVEQRGERAVVLHFRLLEVLVVVLVGGLELAGIVALGVLGGVLAAVGVEFQADLADGDLDVAVGELLRRGPPAARAWSPRPMPRSSWTAEPLAGELDDQLQVGLDPAEVPAQLLGVERAVAVGVGRREVLGVDRELAGAQPIVAGRRALARPLVVFLEQEPDRDGTRGRRPTARSPAAPSRTSRAASGPRSSPRSGC